MAENATKQTERLATAIREMQDEGMKVNKSRLSSYMNEEKGDGISTVTIGKYFDKAMKQVNGSSSTGNASPSTGAAGDKGRSELLGLYFKSICYSYGETSEGEELQYEAIADAIPSGWRALPYSQLIKKIQGAISPELDGSSNFCERFRNIELLGFYGPSDVFIDAGGIHCKHLEFIVRVDYTNEVEGLDEDYMEDTRADLQFLLCVDLCFEWATLHIGETGSFGAEVIDSIPDGMVERHGVWGEY